MRVESRVRLELPPGGGRRGMRIDDREGVGMVSAERWVQTVIEVHHDPDRPLVSESLHALLNRELVCMTIDEACGGHGGCIGH